MQDAMSHLTISTTTTAASLDSLSKQTTQEIHQAQLLISDSAHHLSGVLDDLVQKTSNQMEAIDVAAVELKEKLLPPREASWLSYESVGSERWWKGNLVKVLGFLLRGAPLSIWIDSPFLKILEIVWIVMFWVLQRSLSTVTVSFALILASLDRGYIHTFFLQSLVVLCLSCRKFIRRLLVSSSPNSAPSNGPHYDQEKLVGELFWTHPQKPHDSSYGSTTIANFQQQQRLQASTAAPYSDYMKSSALPVLPSSQARIMSSRTRLTAIATVRLKTSRIPDRLCNPA
ncbi:hypothetical protein BT96DRAFT_722020 [Gymnopus androsaceus JB14]|uniref:Uncharacterized protein n=1 Tax=Gymnopus androsaceus JB14 TaxID=1447944 RepID=A0A6A4HKR8_9AGAR|nr:hypothetical protein BT96DRAFT_722020 [Gymnopus androsaceus JB14]